VLPDSYSPYSQSPLHRVLRVLQSSFHLGRFFSIDVRVFWVALIVLPLFTLYQFRELAPVLGMGTVLGLTVFVNLALYFIIYTHEMSHIAAGWRYGIQTRLITLSPLGGVAHMGAPAPRPSSEVVIALAGPAVHLLWLAVVAPFYFGASSIFAPDQWVLPFIVETLWDMNLLLLVFNLLPCFPMDGGRVLRAGLAMRIDPNRATVIACRVGIVAGVLFVLYGLIFQKGLFATILILIGISNVLACRQELVAARYQPSPYGPAEHRAAWEADPDAWKHGGGGGGAASYDPSSAAEGEKGTASWLEGRRERKSEELKEELDRILAKITAVGMDGLTRAEKKTLDRASKAARKEQDSS
jgi:Zn-dependent protease